MYLLDNSAQGSNFEISGCKVVQNGKQKFFTAQDLDSRGPWGEITVAVFAVVQLPNTDQNKIQSSRKHEKIN